MNKKYPIGYVNFSGIGFLAVIVVSSLFTISPFLQKALAQEETPMTNATELMSNQTNGLSLFSSVLNISRSA
jgi:hypothetical protein